MSTLEVPVSSIRKLLFCSNTNRVVVVELSSGPTNSGNSTELEFELNINVAFEAVTGSVASPSP